MQVEHAPENVNGMPLTIAVVTRRQDLWQGLCRGQAVESFAGAALHWKCLPQQELFVQFGELHPHILLFDANPDALPTIETIRQLARRASWYELDIVTLCSSEESDKLVDLETCLCLGQWTSTETIRRVLLRFVSMHVARMERERLQGQVEALRERHLDQQREYATFAGRLSHEVRTPLGVIEGFTMNMIDGLCGDLSPEQQRSLEVIQKNIHRLNDYLGDILDHSRIRIQTTPLPVRQPDEHTKRRNFRRRFHSPLEVLHDIAELFQGSFARKQIAFSTSLPGELPRIWMEQSKIRQVLINVLSNALKYTPSQGRVELRAMVAGEERESGGREQAFLRIEVEDSGIGMDPELIPALFEDFVRDERVEGAIPGTGIGLAVCRQIVQEHRGELTIDSEPDVGTCVKVTLPIDLRRRRPPRLFMLQNQTLFHDLMQALPASIGSVEIVQTPEECQQMLQDGEPNLLFVSDALMENGIETLDEEKKDT
jgi:signal transduction histidine kinase